MLFVGGNECVFSFEQVDEFEGDFELDKFFDIVMVLIDCGSDVFDGFHEFLDLVAGGYFVIENRGNELGMFFEGGD